ncbi:protein of unknown function [Acidithiobacillus ferrivorans]|nr:protein of unknown function [Acidithiobacillus ferrivorans]
MLDFSHMTLAGKKDGSLPDLHKKTGINLIPVFVFTPRRRGG